MKGEVSIKDVTYKHKSGVDIIPSSLSFEDVLNTTPKNIRKELNELGKDIILVDVATGLDRETLNAIEMCDDLLLVTHPELPTISDALRTKSVAAKYNKNVLGVVLNRVTKGDELKKKKFRSFL